MDRTSPKRRRRLQAPSCTVFAALVLFASVACLRADGLGSNEEDAQPNTYQADSLLKDAYTYWCDYTHRDRETAVALFQKYIDPNPDSPFLPEIYFRIGEMYLFNRSSEWKETDREIATKYSELAHKGYGERYSYQNLSAWSYLAIRSGSIAKMREYYDWLRRFGSSGTVDDIYPIRSMTVCVQGLAPEMDDEQKQNILTYARKNIPSSIVGLEEQMVYSAGFQTFEAYSEGKSELALNELVKAYPGTRLAALAQEILDRKRAETTDEMGRQVALRFDMSDEESQTSPDSLASTGLSLASSPAPPTTPEPQKPTRRTNTTALALATVVLVLLAAFLFIRARRGAGTDS